MKLKPSLITIIKRKKVTLFIETSQELGMKGVFKSLVAVIFQSVFRSEIYQNNIFFKKIYF
jgi:hypothetical protein